VTLCIGALPLNDPGHGNINGIIQKYGVSEVQTSVPKI